MPWVEAAGVMLGIAADGEQAAVHSWVQRFRARPSIISGKPVCSDTSFTARPGAFERLGGAAGGEESPLRAVQGPWQASTTPGLVGDRGRSGRWLRPPASAMATSLARGALDVLPARPS